MGKGRRAKAEIRGQRSGVRKRQKSEGRSQRAEGRKSQKSEGRSQRSEGRKSQKSEGRSQRSKVRSQKSEGRKRQKTEVRGQKSEVRGRPSEIEKKKAFHGVKKSEGRGQEGELKEAFSEKDVPEPQDPYAVSKWEAEQVLHEIAEATGLEVVILRPPLVYGPGVKANFLRLMRSVARGVPFPLANVNNRRSLIYIENLVDAVVTCITHPEAAGQTYLVSDGEEVSTPELIRRVGSALGRPARMFPFPTFLMRLTGRLLGKSAEIERLLGSLTVDTAKIRRELDWDPPYTMAQGLKETAKWYLKRRNISRKGAKTLR